MKKRVLVLDDDRDILNIISDVLMASGAEVKAVLGTGDILGLVESFNPDIVLLDYLLDGINGGELCCQIKNNPKTSHLPVILISAHPKVLLSLGTYKCDMIIPKPFDIDNLVSKVNRLTEYAL
jgi:DNA-binding response OmpR family regulator